MRLSKRRREKEDCEAQGGERRVWELKTAIAAFERRPWPLRIMIMRLKWMCAMTATTLQLVIAFCDDHDNAEVGYDEETEGALMVAMVV